MRKGAQNESSTPKVKLRLIELEVEGPNAAESLRTIAAALTNRVGKTTPRLPGGAMHTEKVDDEATEDEAVNEDVEAPIEVAAEGSRPTRTRGPRKAPVAPDPIEDLDIASGKMPLAEFTQQTGPDSDWKRYLVIAYWFKHHRKLNEITTRHIFTCYKLLKWSPVPPDLGAPFREMKNKQRWFAKGGEANTWAIGLLGENEVEALLKKA